MVIKAEYEYYHFNYNINGRREKKMLDVIEVNERLVEMSLLIKKLNFVIQNQLNETENRIERLKNNGSLDILFESGLERCFMNLDIANDYRAELQKLIENTLEETFKEESSDNEI